MYECAVEPELMDNSGVNAPLIKNTPEKVEEMGATRGNLRSEETKVFENIRVPWRGTCQCRKGQAIGGSELAMIQAVETMDLPMAFETLITTIPCFPAVRARVQAL
jgi:hypothetical protein